MTCFSFHRECPLMIDFFVMSHYSDSLSFFDNDSHGLATTEIALHHYDNKIHENFGTFQYRWKKIEPFRARTKQPSDRVLEEHARKNACHTIRRIDSRTRFYCVKFNWTLMFMRRYNPNQSVQIQKSFNKMHLKWPVS